MIMIQASFRIKRNTPLDIEKQRILYLNLVHLSVLEVNFQETHTQAINSILYYILD